MSGLTVGQAFGSIVGFGVGYVVGGPTGAMIGMSLGGMVGGWIDPPPAPDPPPLGDLGINSFVHNAPLPIVIGTSKVYGGCIWIGNIDTGMDEGGSKKSPEYSAWMTVQFAVGHCEGPVNEILQYFINDHTMTEAEADGMGMSYTSYLGTSDQTIDPDIDTFVSGTLISPVPFKYTCYTVALVRMSGGYFSSVPSLSAEINGLLTETGELDANPIRALYWFMTDERVGMNIDPDEFDGDPDTINSTWYDAAAICDEEVSYIDGDDVTVNEPRYRYSNTIDNRTKAYDIINDILYSCCGMISLRQGKIIVKIENDSEVVEGHFSNEYIVQYETASGSTVSQVNFTATFDEPDGFWEGAYGGYTVGGNDYEFCMLEQGTNYIVPCENMDSPLAAGITVTFKKDNIKEGTFNFNKVPVDETNNRIRVEFLNREWLDYETDVVENKYAWDVVEWDDSGVYVDPSYSRPDKPIKERQVRAQGIKRKSQATRLSRFLCDFSKYNKWYCEFVTDIYGIAFSLSDIITITHPLTNWLFKEFRIINMEELENGEVKFSCFEYSRDVYNDFTGKIITSTSYELPNPFAIPSIAERFFVVLSSSANKIFIQYKIPEGNNYWTGVMVYVKESVAADYEYNTRIVQPTYSVKLSEAIDATQTSIPYDDTTLYGSFPAIGYIIVEDEVMAYTAISATAFTVTRGAEATSHTISQYIRLMDYDSNSFIQYPDTAIGQTWTIKIVGVGANDLTSDWSTSPTNSVTIIE